MNKDFSQWHKNKEFLHNEKKRPFFHEGEVWFCILGANIGFEQDGRGELFLRPAILSQIRLVDGKRLNYKIGNIPKEDFIGIKKRLAQLLA